MAKISVRHGIARAYGFLFGRLFQVIGLSWLPALLYAVAATYLLQRMSGAMQTAVPADDGLLGEYAFAYFFALVIVTAFLGAVIAVPLTREALGRHEEPVAAHFVVGGREARLFLALLRFYALVTIMLVALVILSGIAVTTAARYAGPDSAHFNWMGIPFQKWLNAGAGLVGSVIFVLMATKLGFLLTPVASLEKHAKLVRAAQLSRGNFWRLAFVYVVVGLPATLVLLACETTFGGLEMGKTLPRGMQAFYTVDHDHIALFATILAGGLVVLHALFAGAAAAAYDELEGGAVYERAPAQAPAAVMPAAAYADMRAALAPDLRPGDQRASMREDLASRAASDFSAPIAEPVPAVPESPVQSAQSADAQGAHQPAAVAASEEQSAVAHEAAASTDAVSTEFPQAAEGHGTGEAVAAEAQDAPAEELPPLDPMAMSAAQHTETAPQA